ncbi:MAG: TRAP transporter TatT component family protein [Spirochaetales bacterium]|nr:TRAP transporter TatT component family protein [Spirochaetales bacterium]
MKKYLFTVLSVFMLVSILTGCSINKLAVNMVADMLSGEESLVFVGDDDPELIGEALPFALKLYESLLESNPDNKRLLLACGKAFCLYAFSNVQTPASMLPDDEFEKQEKMNLRAKKLFLRAKKYVLHALELENPEFVRLLSRDESDKAFLLINDKDLPYLYWTGTAWMGAVSTDPFDMSLLVSLPLAVKCIEKVVDIDDSYDSGGAHELLLSYYGALPEGMGNGEEKARFHFNKAVEYSRGEKASPYLALATSVCISKQDIEEFKSLIDMVIAIDTTEPSEFRLFNILAQQKARWYSDHIEDFFIVE